jgi:hypothetical protein
MLPAIIFKVFSFKARRKNDSQKKFVFTDDSIDRVSFNTEYYDNRGHTNFYAKSKFYSAG